MSGRYFTNNLQDFVPGGTVNIPHEAILAQIDATKQQIIDGTKFDTRSCEGGLYLGVAGTAFALTRLLETPVYHDDKLIQQFVDKGLEASLKYEDTHQKRENRPGLLIGSAGVLLTAAIFHKVVGDSGKEVSQNLQRYKALKDICNPPAPADPDYLGCGSDEILLGRAGYLYGAHTLSRKLQIKVMDDADIAQICRTVVEVGRQTSRQLSSASPLMYQYHGRQGVRHPDSFPLRHPLCISITEGAAHGLSGIIQTLLNFPEFIKSDQSVERDIKGSVDYLLSVQRPDGNFAPLAEEVQERVEPGGGLVHWCHGAPGVVYLMAKAYLFWKDEKYLQACVRCADLCWKYGLLKKGPGTCHGVAGNGYVFLVMYRLTQEPKHLHRAIKFAEFMECDEFKRNATTPDHPLSLHEGVAGTLCFLIDLLNPSEAEFPLFDIF